MAHAAPGMFAGDRPRALPHRRDDRAAARASWSRCAGATWTGRRGRIRVRQNYVLRRVRHAEVAALDPLGADGRRGRRRARAAVSGARAGRTTATLSSLTPRPASRCTRRTSLRRMRTALSGRAGSRTTHRFHDLRHTFGTRMAAAGVPMRTLRFKMRAPDSQESSLAERAAAAPHTRARGERYGRRIFAISRAPPSCGLEPPSMSPKTGSGCETRRDDLSRVKRAQAVKPGASRGQAAHSTR